MKKGPLPSSVLDQAGNRRFFVLYSLVMLAIVLALMFAATDPPNDLFTGFCIYAPSRPGLSVRRSLRHRGRRNPDPDS
jgi:hypothetical protein